MNIIHPENQPWSTNEGILALCLYLAGAEFSDSRLPVVNRFDPDILSKLGFKGERLWDAASQAWKDGARGHVEYSFKLSQRTHDLIQIYRKQRKELEDKDGKSSVLIMELMQSAQQGTMMPDEAVLRFACIVLVTRSDFFNLWKNAIPLLKIPIKGTSERFESTATVQTPTGPKSVQAQGVVKPGYKEIFLNATPETKKKLGL